MKSTEDILNNEELNDFELLCKNKPEIMETVFKYLSSITVDEIMRGRPFFESTSPTVTNEELKTVFMLFQENVNKKLIPFIKVIYDGSEQEYTKGIIAVAKEIRELFVKNLMWQALKNQHCPQDEELAVKLLNVVSGAMMFKMMEPWIIEKSKAVSELHDIDIQQDFMSINTIIIKIANNVDEAEKNLNSPKITNSTIQQPIRRALTSKSRPLLLGEQPMLMPEEEQRKKNTTTRLFKSFSRNILSDPGVKEKQQNTTTISNTTSSLIREGNKEKKDKKEKKTKNKETPQKTNGVVEEKNESTISFNIQTQSTPTTTNTQPHMINEITDLPKKEITTGKDEKKSKSLFKKLPSKRGKIYGIADDQLKKAQNENAKKEIDDPNAKVTGSPSISSPGKK